MLIVVTENSENICTRSQSNEDIFEIKSEPKEVHDCMSEQIENNSESSELSQKVDEFSENKSGSYY